MGVIDGAVVELRSADAVRRRCWSIYEAALNDELEHFVVNEPAYRTVLSETASQVGLSYPDGPIPIHGRLNHLRATGADVVGELVDRVGDGLVDFVIFSVLVDAGAGPVWQFNDPGAGSMGRSEGLAYASFRALEAGVVSSTGEPWHIDAEGLAQLDEQRFAAAFQARSGNELAGLSGRVALCRQFGHLVAASGCTSAIELIRKDLADASTDTNLLAGSIQASALLGWVLERFADLWPGRLEIHGHNLGDTWRHPASGGHGENEGLVPFHKLSQWLTYSLVEPLGMIGVLVTNIARLTGLAEYRNGGMLLDLGMLQLRCGDPVESLSPGAELIVEWRALTVAILDRIAADIGDLLPADRAGIGLGELLEAGTWPLGRRLAFQRSPDGEPPIRISSDGTVF